MEHKKYNTLLSLIRNAAHVLEEKNEIGKLPSLCKPKIEREFDNSSSFTLQNRNICDNLRIQQHRHDLSDNERIIKFDDTLRKGSRNRIPYTTNPEIKLSTPHLPRSSMEENIKFKEIGEIYQREEDLAAERVTGKEINKHVQGETLKHFISQVKFLLQKTKYGRIKDRLQRLLDYLFSGRKSVMNLGISPKGKVTEGTFDTGVSFQHYLNYIITADEERREKPNFYDQIFGQYVEHPQLSVTTHKSELQVKRNNKIPFLSNLQTIPLRNIQVKTKDSRDSNNKWLRGVFKLVQSTDDIITLACSTAFCLDGPTISRYIFNKKYNKLFLPIVHSLE